MIDILRIGNINIKRLTFGVGKYIQIIIGVDWKY